MHQSKQTFESKFSAKSKLFLVAILLCLGLPLQALAQSPMVYQVVIDTADGTRIVEPIEGFSVGLEGEEPRAALLLPAVQSAREAARRMGKASSTGEMLPVVIIEGGEEGAKPYLTIKLENVFVSSYSLGGSSGDTVPTEQLSLNYERIKVEYDRAETVTYDCMDICVNYSHKGF